MRHEGFSTGRRLLMLLLMAGAFGVYLLGAPSEGFAFASGAYGGFTGAPGEDTCRHCHKTSPLNAPGGALRIDGFPERYVPEQTYRVTVTLESDSGLRWGFQATALTDGGRRAGTLVVADAQATKVVPGIFFTDRRYIEQKKLGSYPDRRAAVSWAFDWRAPKKNKGPITLYACGNAGNDNDKSTGDLVYFNRVISLPADGT